MHSLSHPVPPYMRPRQAAAFLNVSVATLWRWHSSRHDFPRARKLGPGVTEFATEELQAYRERQPLTHKRGA